MQSLLSTPWDNNSRPTQKLNRASALFDAFGRLRVSDVSPLFDSKLSLGKLPLYWDEVTSANASSTHVEVDSCVNMAVTANGAYAIRQTRQRWNYQPGRSQLIKLTFKMSTVQGVTSRVGPFHGNYAAPHLPHDGIYFEVADGIASCNIVKGTESGGVVGTEKARQSEWNIDRLDGTGPSGYIADWSKCQILLIDFQWLGVGGVRYAIEVDSVIHYVHEFKHAGIVESVYMHNGTQPIRYEIRSTGGTGTLMQICSSVSSEGGMQKTGITTAVDTDGVLVSCPTGVIEMLIAVRIDPNNPDGQLLLEKAYTLNTAANATYAEFALNWTAPVLANWFAEWGLGNPTTAIATHTDGAFFRITAGQFRGVCVNNSVETYVDLGPIPAEAMVHDFVIEYTMGAVNFWHESNLLGTVEVPATQFGPTAQSALPLFVRTYNAAIALASPIKLQVSAISASNGGADMERLWDFMQAGQGNMGIQAPTGTAVAQTSNNVNITGPVSATLANATAGYATLGGQFQFAAVVGAETDYALFAYQVPVGQTLTIRGIKIDAFNTGAAVATTATVLQWSLGIGASAVTLLTADGAATKASHRMSLGIQAFAIGDAIGKVADTVDFLDMSPKTVNSGEYLHIILKMPLGTATASQIIRGTVAIDGFWE